MDAKFRASVASVAYSVESFDLGSSVRGDGVEVGTIVTRLCSLSPSDTNQAGGVAWPELADRAALVTWLMSAAPIRLVLVLRSELELKNRTSQEVW